MTDTTRSSVLDLCEGFTAGLAIMPNVRQLGFALDALLANGYDSGVESVSLTASELSSVRVENTPLNVDWIVNLLPKGFIEVEPRLTSVGPADAQVTALENVYEFDLKMLRAATPGKVSGQKEYQAPLRSARSFERTRHRGRFG